LDPNKSESTEQNRKNVTMGVVALAVVSLLAGASVAATLEDYAAPVYAEEDPFEGAVDDVTGEDTWEAKETDGKPMGKHIRKAMKSRMNDRMEDRAEHLEKRIDIDSNLIAAFQFCLDSSDCTADSESLSEMIEKLTWAVDGMQAKLDGTDSVTIEWYDCSTEEVWSEEKEEWCEENEEDKADKTDDYQICIREENGVVHYDCDDGKFKDWDERKHWDETERMEFAEEKFIQLRAAQEAIAFCIESDDCSADSETIGTALRHMTSRADHHSECADERRCHRDHDMRKGFRGRMGGAICKMLDRCDDRETDERPPVLVITQEMCESRMGVWTEATDRGEGVFYCEWSELDTEPEEEDDSSERDGDDDADSPDNQEDCEASGGTWYEDRQYCHSE